MAGRFASINGATQIRAGVIRPEIVIPLSNEELMEKHQEISESGGIKAGSVVRVIRAPYFGRIGKIVDLPSELRKMESETMVRVAEVEIDNEQFLIPRANLEIVETD
jgi:transcription antitermination factor NusG